MLPILGKALKSRPAPSMRTRDFSRIWPVERFGLREVSLFRGASVAQQQEIVAACARGLLEEAYFIEKCGMDFASRMVLLSETTEEKMLYSLFAADEAAHFSWIRPFVETEGHALPDPRMNPFLELLRETVSFEQRTVLIYVIQVILEGWGISHYHSLAQDCSDVELSSALGSILKDEARHHGSGLVLFNEATLSPQLLDRLVGVLAKFFGMVQAGPQSLVGQLEKVLGHLSVQQKARAFEELRAPEQTAEKLSGLRSLIRSAQGSEQIIGSLERYSCFEPWSAARCAGVGSA